MNYHTIRLTDIAVRTLTPYKVTLAHYGVQDHCRWVLRGLLPGSTDTFFYKIWNPTYVRRDNILAAIESGFYDERMVPALYGVIFHKGLCRGYVMHEGRIDREALTDEFRDFVFLRTKQTGFFAAQFARCHTMIYKDKVSLLDLEGVYPIDSLPRLSQCHSRCEDSAYENFVVAWYKQLSSNSALTTPAASRALPFASGQILSEDRPQRLAAESSFYIRFSRRMIRKLRNIMPQIRLIEY